MIKITIEVKETDAYSVDDIINLIKNCLESKLIYSYGVYEDDRSN